ncbi:MAG: lysophospholipid acyltransferase family protein [Smithellaceae bacterium]|nr:lysophospholipid acyltransferase family protein [Smithellaceae bacterium]
MYYTVFDTPVIRTIARCFSVFMLKVMGWRTAGRLPDIPRFVLIVAPHTSNWDFLIGFFAAFALRAKVYWMGKASLFRFPFGSVVKWMGGIPIDRSKSNDTVKQTIAQFFRHEKLIIAIPPSGTRKRVKEWKTGFYYISRGAGVPIVLGFINYKNRTAGFGPVYVPVGDIETDMREIQAYYADIQGRYTA